METCLEYPKSQTSSIACFPSEAETDFFGAVTLPWAKLLDNTIFFQIVNWESFDRDAPITASTQPNGFELNGEALPPRWGRRNVPKRLA